MTLTAFYVVTPENGPKEFVKVTGLLGDVYGNPSDRTYEVLGKCPQGLADCIGSKQATFQAFWAFKDQHAIDCSLERYKGDPIVLMLQYMTPETPASKTHPGL